MKPKHWRQKSPADQLTATLMALEGHFDNLKENIITLEKYVAQTQPVMNDLQALLPYVRGDEKWDFE